jgi:hypothetical protein
MIETKVSTYERYLYFSYVPRTAEAALQWLNCDFEYDFGLGVEDENWWIQEGVKALKKTMAEQVRHTDQNALHVLPLSGGLDSRAILGGLLENVPPSQIVATTYGIPGAWDFEIGKLIARKSGIRHEAIDLTNDKWDIDDLTRAASRLKLPVSVHQSYVRQKINDYFGKDCVYWSGFMGDAFGGSYLPEVPNTDKKEAIRRLVNTAPTPNYKDQSFREEIIEEILLECPWDHLANRKFSLDQQVDIGIRQNFLHRPLVLVDGFTFKTPFMTPTWGNFMVNVPYPWLLGFRLYKKIITEGYRELAKIPSTTNAGMPIPASRNMVRVGRLIGRIQPYMRPRDSFHSHPRTNYINFTEALRHRGSLQDSVQTTLEDLKKRGLFDPKDLDQWWCDHLNKKIDYTRLLMNLSSLELLLKMGLI